LPFIRIETGSLAAALELGRHTRSSVRPKTKHLEAATRARREGRKPVFGD